MSNVKVYLYRKEHSWYRFNQHNLTYVALSLFCHFSQLYSCTRPKCRQKQKILAGKGVIHFAVEASKMVNESYLLYRMKVLGVISLKKKVFNKLIYMFLNENERKTTCKIHRFLCATHTKGFCS